MENKLFIGEHIILNVFDKVDHFVLIFNFDSCASNIFKIQKVFRVIQPPIRNRLLSRLFDHLFPMLVPHFLGMKVDHGVLFRECPVVFLVILQTPHHRFDLKFNPRAFPYELILQLQEVVGVSVSALLVIQPQ